jgi:hypothetical protein
MILKTVLSWQVAATGSALVQPIQLLQDLYIELNNSFTNTESNKIFYMLKWDAAGAVTCSTNVITHHIPNLTAQQIIENTTHWDAQDS